MLQTVEAAKPGQVLYSRYSDGARPVRVVPSGWEVLSKKNGKPIILTTAQSLLTELTGHPTGRHWSLDRYFALGAHAPKEHRYIGQANILDLFQVTPTRPSGIVLLEPLAPTLLALRSTSADLSVPAEKRRESESRRSRFSKHTSGVVISGPVGIDLVHRSGEVRKLLFSGFGKRIFAAGYDPEDVLQEVYRGLLARNKGTCPWDPAKSSFGHYVHMVCGCVLSNYHRKQNRVRQFEQCGLPSYQDGEYAYQDAASNTTVPARPTLNHEASLMAEAHADLVDFMLDLPYGDSNEARLAIDVLPFVASGVARAETAQHLNVSSAAVSRAVSFLRQAAAAWRTHLHSQIL